MSDVCAQQSGGSQNVFSRMLRSSKSLEKHTSGPPATCSYDVHCFGKVLLELITGNFGISGPNAAASEESEWLANTLNHINAGDKASITSIIDPLLVVDEDHLEEVWAVAIIAKTCLSSKPSRRPSARYVLRALENPLRVVRASSRSNSARLLRSSSSRSSWQSVFQGNRVQSLDAAVASSAAGQALDRRYSVRSYGSGGEASFSFKRATPEIVPEPVGLAEEDDGGVV
uniref:WPK1 n=1 Tax=Arundo donax TaxID=35708 RepID=A0A0A8ZVX3_ARUDO